jgi:hypothetical protein
MQHEISDVESAIRKQTTFPYLGTCFSLPIGTRSRMNLGKQFEWVDDLGTIPKESFEWIDAHTVRVYYPEEFSTEWFQLWNDDECSKVETLSITYDGFCDDGLPFALLRLTNLQRLCISSTRLWLLQPERLPPSLRVLYLEDIMNTDTRPLKTLDKYCPNLEALVIDSDSVIIRRRAQLPPLPLLRVVVLTDYYEGQTAGFFGHYDIEEVESIMAENCALNKKFFVRLKKTCNHRSQ